LLLFAAKKKVVFGAVRIFNRFYLTNLLKKVNKQKHIKNIEADNRAAQGVN